MPKYLALFSYTNEAIAAMIETPADREAAVKRAVESVGAQLESFSWKRGQFDGMAVIDARDSITMAGIESAVKGSGAVVHSETHDLFSSEDIQHVLERARLARDHFALPGQSG